MDPWQLLPLVVLSLTAGILIVVLRGLALWLRQNRRPPLDDCVPPFNRHLAAGAAALSLALLLRPGAGPVPWSLLGELALLVAAAQPLLAFLGPPDHFVALCQMGRFCAYSHFYGYLYLMRREYDPRRRLKDFKASGKSTGLTQDQLERLHTSAVLVLAPVDGIYPDCSLAKISGDELSGVGAELTSVPAFSVTVGGTERSYGRFSVREVTSSDGRRSALVALDTIGALNTLRKVRDHAPAGLDDDACLSQIRDMIAELEKVIDSRFYMAGHLRLVKFKLGRDHIGDKILEAIETPVA